jgi:hypothetical protein
MNWYKITAKETHNGGKGGTQVIYVWEKGIVSVLDKYKTLRGVPRNKLPEIRPLDSQEVSLLEKAIIEDRKWNVELAKKEAIRYDARGNCLPPV